ncbi:MAG: cupin domain-containing protein [Solirubrobacteraceae bacterium]
MKINHGRVAGMPSAQRGETFTGTVWSEPLLRDVPGVIVNTVFFPPGVRTHWHSHETGQILIVTHGSGLAFNEDGDGGAIIPGDVVWLDPGERHWHGARPDTWMSHVAISLGTTQWEDAVTDDEYSAVG